MRIEAGTARRQGFKMPILCGPATQPENALHLGNQAQCSVLPPTERFDRLPLQLLPTLPAPPHRAAGRARRFRSLPGRLPLPLVPAHASQDVCVLRTAFADQPTSSPPITPCNAVCRTGDSRFWKSDSGRQRRQGQRRLALPLAPPRLHHTYDHRLPPPKSPQIGHNLDLAAVPAGLSANADDHRLAMLQSANALHEPLGPEQAGSMP